jgi:hypothetical protein
MELGGTSPKGIVALRRSNTDMDISAWDVARDLPHGFVYWMKPGVIVGWPDDGVVETVDLSQIVWDAYSECAKEFGRPVGCVVFVDRLGDQTADVRAFWQKIMTPDVLCCCALVSTSFFARAITAFFLGMRPPVVPTKMFGSEEDALAWVDGHLNP